MTEKNSMKLCAVLLNYHGHKETIECVDGLVEQDVDKIFILDNSKSDKEVAILTKYFSDCAKVEIVPSGENPGFAGGINCALKKMMPLEFDSFLILNNDTILTPDLVKNLIHGADERSLEIASPVIYNYPEQNILWSRGNYYNTWTGLITHQSIPFLPGNFYYLTGCCLLIRRKVFESVGLFDEDFFMYGEDVEFCHRAVSNKYRLGIVPNAVIYHKTGSSSVQNSLFYEYHINRAHFLLCGKLFGTTKLLKILTTLLKLFFLGLRAFVRTCRFRNLNALRGYAKALADAALFR